MKDLLHVYHFIHDSGLAKVSWNAVEHQCVDVGFEFVCFHRSIDCLSPQLHRDMIRNKLTFAGVFQECFAHLCTRVDGTEDVATSAVIITRDRAERLALRAFAAAWRAKKNKSVVSRHQRNPFIPHADLAREAESAASVLSHMRVHMHS